MTCPCQWFVFPRPPWRVLHCLLDLWGQGAQGAQFSRLPESGGAWDALARAAGVDKRRVGSRPCLGRRLVCPEEIEHPVKMPWRFTTADVHRKLRKSYPSLEGWWMNRSHAKKAGGLPLGCSIPAKRGSPVGEAGFHVFLLLRRLRPAVLAQWQLVLIRDSRGAAFFRPQENTRGRASFKLCGRSCRGTGKGQCGRLSPIATTHATFLLPLCPL